MMETWFSPTTKESSSPVSQNSPGHLVIQVTSTSQTLSPWLVLTTSLTTTASYTKSVNPLAPATPICNNSKVSSDATFNFSSIAPPSPPTLLIPTKPFSKRTQTASGRTIMSQINWAWYGADLLRQLQYKLKLPPWMRSLVLHVCRKSFFWLPNWRFVLLFNDTHVMSFSRCLEDWIEDIPWLEMARSLDCWLD